MKALYLITGLMVTIMALPAGAAETAKKSRRDHRVLNQNQSIKKQFKNGNLTYDEANNLRARSRKVQAAIKAAEADGTVTAEEKAKIEAKQDKVRAAITLQSTDAQETNGKSRARTRQFNQHERIQDGVADGSLTEEEAAGIKAYIKANNEMIKGAKADGTLTDEEKKRIEARQDFLSADIYLKRHNGATRSPASTGTGTETQSTDSVTPESTTPPVSDPAANPWAGTVPAESTY